MFGTDPDQAQRRVSQWAQQFADRAERFQTMREQVEQISVTESSSDGAVRVTVDSTGAPTDLVLTDKIRSMAPPEVAAQVMACLRRAQGRLAGRVEAAMAATVGDDEQVIDHVVAGYRARFPDEQKDNPPRRPAQRGSDDDDFGDQSYLR